MLLNNFGNSLISRFRRLGELSDLERAISTLRDAVDLTPHGHLDKPTFLHNLGNFFDAHFKRLRELSDLERAVLTHRDAVDLTPHGHLQKPCYLNNLGNSFVLRILVFHIQLLFLIPDSRTVYDLIFTLFILLITR